jgi:hypothetical protein
MIDSKARRSSSDWPTTHRAGRAHGRPTSPLREHARGHREELQGVQDDRRERRADGAMEPMYPRAEIRQTDLGADVGAVGVAIAAGASAGGCDPRHRREVPLVLRTLRHVVGAERRGLSDDKLTTIVAGQRPATSRARRRSRSTSRPASSTTARGRSLAIARPCRRLASTGLRS